MSLTLGHIAYLNCVPFFHYLREAGFEGKIVDGVPSELNRMLAAGEIDVSPSSSFEYGLNWEKYLLLPDMSISSRGPVQSVLLFSPVAIEELCGFEIALTGESATSVNLLRILLWEYIGIQKIKLSVPTMSIEDALKAGLPALLIGDRALKAAAEPLLGCRVYDLGELWYRFTGLPFVFALWILRRDAAERKKQALKKLEKQLHISLQQARSNLLSVSHAAAERSWLDEKAIYNYWLCMSYRLGEDHLRGLRLYFDLCQRHGLLRTSPGIEFFST